MLNIRSLTLLGDQTIELNRKTTLTEEPEEVGSVYDIVDEVWEENGDHAWFYLGKRYDRGTVTDLSLLGRMTNLQHLCLLNQGEIDLTPLNSLTTLRSLELDDCLIHSVAPLSALADLNNLGLKNNQVTDLSPLAACGHLETAYISHLDIKSLDGLGPNLQTLELWNVEQLSDISALAGCAGLRTLRVENGNRLTDLTPLSGAAYLQEVSFVECERLRDLSALGTCANLSQLEIQDVPASDLSFLATLKGLKELHVHDTGVDSLDFLWDAATANLSLSCDERIQDHSGLAAKKLYPKLVFFMDNPSYADEVQPYLAGAEVHEMKLVRCRNLDLAALPTGLKHLDLQKVPLESLAGIGENKDLEILTLCSLDRLSSLSGLEAVQNPLYLTLENCLRLTDWEALYTPGLLQRLDIRNDALHPDFSRLSWKGQGELELDNAYSILDLTDFAALPPSAAERLGALHLRNMDWLTDLRPIAGLTRLKKLTVPYQLEAQVAEVTKNMPGVSTEIAYPSGEWEQDDSELTLLRMEELDALPDAVLQRVSEACFVGDQVMDPQAMEYDCDWQDGKPIYYLAPRDESRQDEREYVGRGTLDSLEKLQKLTNLRRLALIEQPLASLEGIQALSRLRELQAQSCPVTDASPVFALTELEFVSLSNTDIVSIQGVQNLPELRRLEIGGTKVTELSPLAACDFSAAMEEGGLELNIQGIPCEDCSPLAAAEAYRRLEVNDLPAQSWLPPIAGKRVESLIAFNAGLTDPDVATIAALPGLRELHLSWNLQVTDLTPLCDAPELEYVKINGEMKQAVNSLKGKDLRFRLEVEN